MIITTQPENYFGSVGGTATFTVAAEGDRITYQWQRSINDGETWDNISDGTSTTLSVPIQASLNGYLYRCIAKDFMGHIATSQAGKLTVASGTSAISEFDPEYTIINEPDDYYGRPGDIATFIVEAEGANLSYQWLCRAPGASNFEYLTSSDATTNTLRVEMTAASNGAEYRCFITDANGDMGATRIATVKLDILDWEMEYNTSGIRTKRVSEEKTYNYIYAGDKLMRMTVGNDTLDFSYDTNGVPLTCVYNGTVYYYITNLQGDVIRLDRADGGGAATYAYDAWGNILRMSGTLAELNPLRYRGYVYDQETGLYYVSSRYYDPVIGRFVSPDNVNLLGANGDFASMNLFAYCGNNPVARKDESGYLWTNILIGAGIGAIAGVVGQVLSDVVTSTLNGKVTISNWQTYTGAIIGGAAGGAALAVTGNMNVANTVTGAVTTGVGMSLEKLTIKNYNKSWTEIGANTLADGAISYGLGKLPGFKGKTAGRNSWSAVYKSGLTKLRNGTAARMSTKVIAKGFGSSVFGGFALDGYYGIKQYAYDKIKRFWV